MEVFTTIITPNWIAEIPQYVAKGSRSGAMMVIAARPSIKQPSISIITLIINIMITGLEDIPLINDTSLSGTF